MLERVRSSADPLAEHGLVYADETVPTIRRRKSGRGFGYRMPDGSPVRDPQTLARIRSLAIPPAYTDVRIAVDPQSHIQATGRDARGRKQYRYHPDWTDVRAETKYATLVAFGRALPALRQRIDTALRRRSLDRERVVGSLVWLLDNTLVRVGNAAYARDNKSFGLTTLRSRHVTDDGRKLLLRFKGKSGKQWSLPLHDRRIMRVIRAVQELPGQSLFQYLDEDGTCHEVRSQEVNDYIREAAGADFSSKHFRTWAATVAAASELREVGLPQTKRETAQTLNAVIDRVAKRLGNTRSVCRNSYIHPLVVERWLAGSLGQELSRHETQADSDAWLDEDEQAVLSWLEENCG